MNPEESTNTTTFRTRRHPCRDLKLGKSRPYTSLINTKDSEILRLNIRHVVLIHNTQRTSFQVVEPIRMVLLSGRIRTDVVWIIGFSDITTLGRSEKGSGAFVTSDFGCSWLSSWELENVSWIRRVGEMIVKPPFFENHVLDRSNGSIVIGKGTCSNIEAEHTGMINSYISEKE